MHRFVSGAILSILLAPPIIFADVNIWAVPDETGSGATPVSVEVAIPFSLVDKWSTQASFSFPQSVKRMNSTQLKALQVFLVSRGYDTQLSGTFGPLTKSALSELQDGNIATLSPETVAGIDELFSYLYCPSRNAEAQDFRLENVNHPDVLPERYVPKNLVLDDGAIGGYQRVCLEQETLSKFRQMHSAARADGVPLYVTSSYRGQESQTYLLQVMKRKLGNYAYRIVATPGQSEHNLGTALDIGGAEGASLSSGQGLATFLWLKKNAGFYGFVNSYPENKEHITGFRAEPWHWRYVGTPVAASVAASGLTLGEFLDTYKNKIQQVTNSVQDQLNTWLSNVVVGG